jgi:hypothetical protein
VPGISCHSPRLMARHFLCRSAGVIGGC